MSAAPLFRASLLAALVAALAPLPGRAESGTATGPGAATAKARLNFRIRIPAVARVESAGHARRIEVRAEDIARGFVDVSGARIVVRANLRGQKRLVAQVTAAFARSVEITGLSTTLLAQPEGEAPLWDTRRGVVDGSYAVRYHIVLAPGIAPGAYPWPVFLRVEAA